MNTSKYEYIQTVNNCEAQYASGEVFMFISIEQTMEWLNKKENNGALLIAHCGVFRFSTDSATIFSERTVTTQKSEESSFMWK